VIKICREASFRTGIHSNMMQFVYVKAMKQESSPLKNLVVPAAVLPFLAPMAAFAAEGTGRVSQLIQLYTTFHVNISHHLTNQSYTSRLSALMTADLSGPLSSHLSSSSHCTYSGPVSRSLMTSSMAMRRDARVKRSPSYSEGCTYTNCLSCK
jgi:hypothetical protein